MEYLQLRREDRNFVVLPGTVAGKLMCGCGLCHDNRISVKLLAVVRSALLEVPGRSYEDLRVLSGFRCEAHNVKTGGAKLSQHLLGNALDIRLNGVQTSTLHKDAMLVYLAGGFAGLGFYPWGIHVDVGPRRNPWGSMASSLWK